MRPLPRLLAFTDDRIGGLDDLGVRAAAIAAAGPAVGLVARLPGGSADRLASLSQRLVALAAAPQAAVLVTGRADIAMAVRAIGVVLRQDDLDVPTVRQMPTRRQDGGRSRTDEPVRPNPLIFRSVHSEAEADIAVQQGADALIVGSIWSSTTHPDRAAAGTGLLAQVVSFGVPTYAIGGITAARAGQVRAAGAWGVAAITAAWDAASPYRAAMDLLEPWMETS